MIPLLLTGIGLLPSWLGFVSHLKQSLYYSCSFHSALPSGFWQYFEWKVDVFLEDSPSLGWGTGCTASVQYHIMIRHLWSFWQCQQWPNWVYVHHKAQTKLLGSIAGAWSVLPYFPSHIHAIVIWLSSAVIKSNLKLLQPFQNQVWQTFTSGLLYCQESNDMLLNLGVIFQWHNSDNYWQLFGLCNLKWGESTCIPLSLAQWLIKKKNPLMHSINSLCICLPK